MSAGPPGSRARRAGALTSPRQAPPGPTQTAAAARMSASRPSSRSNELFLEPHLSRRDFLPSRQRAIEILEPLVELGPARLFGGDVLDQVRFLRGQSLQFGLLQGHQPFGFVQLPFALGLTRRVRIAGGAREFLQIL